MMGGADRNNSNLLLDYLVPSKITPLDLRSYVTNDQRLTVDEAC